MPFRLANVDGRAALATETHYFDLESLSDGAFSSDPMEAISRSDEMSALSAGLNAATPTGPLDGAALESPVPRPQKAFGIGLNYRAHAVESNMDIPDAPLIFAKYPSCIVGPHATVELRSDGVDYEVELVAVIGKRCKDVAVADAWNHVAGLTAGQDISDRPAQFMAKPPQFGAAKSMDTFGPMGPVMVSTDSFENPDDLALTCAINGEMRQDSRSNDLIFDIPSLISTLSHMMTLEVGDVIFTGTPAGVGFAQGKPLVDGDIITTWVEGIGTMTNPCVRVSDWQ